jgi:hypothetical protein
LSFTGRDFLVHPYQVGKNLQPKKLKYQITVNTDLLHQLGQGYGSRSADYWFMKTCCEGKLFPPIVMTKILNCRLLHHTDPYLKLGPFKEEQFSEIPYVVVFHDILTDNEMDFMIINGAPNLSRKRANETENQHISALHEVRSGAKRKIVQKTVQTWFDEVEWPLINVEYVGEKYTHMNYPILWKLTKRIGLATQLKVLESASFFLGSKKCQKIVNIGAITTDVMRKDRAAQQRLFSGTILRGLT